VIDIYFRRVAASIYLANELGLPGGATSNFNASVSVPVFV
jgi:hypothetical protein